MAKNQVITQWVAKTEDYNRKTKESASMLQQVGMRGKEAGSMISQFDKVLGTNIGTLGKLSIAVGGASAALKVAKNAFFANEQNVDEWGRTLECAKGLYDGFLNALNTGDFGGFFTNINNIVSAAREAYNALDELQTKATIIAPAQAKAQAKMLQQKEIIRKKGKDSDEGKAAQEELKRLEGELKEGYKETAKLNREAFISKVKEKAAEAGVTLTQDMWQSFTDTKAFERVRAGAATTTKTQPGWVDTYGNKHDVSTQVDNNNMRFMKAFTDEFRKEVSGYLTAEWSARGAAASAGIGDAKYLQEAKTPKTPKTPKASVSVKTDTAEEATGPLIEMEEELKRLGELQHQAASPDAWKEYQVQIDAVKAQIAEFKGETEEVKVEVKPDALSPAAFDEVLKEIRAKMAQADLTSPLYKNLQEGMADVTALKNVLEFSVNNALGSLGLDTAGMWEKIINGEDIPDEAWAEVESVINERIEGMDIKPIRIDVQTGNLQEVDKTVKTTTNHVQGAASAFSALGNAMSQVEDPGSKVAGLVAEAIGSVVAGYGAATAQAATMGPWAWIAFAATGLATMIATVASIKKATAGAYADGGVVGGSSYYGDKLYARVNSGETILNQEQAKRAVEMMDGGSGEGAGSSSVSLSGEMIKIVLNNHLRSIGVSGDRLIG